jgi:hypothetical protein
MLQFLGSLGVSVVLTFWSVLILPFHGGSKYFWFDCFVTLSSIATFILFLVKCLTVGTVAIAINSLTTIDLIIIVITEMFSFVSLTVISIKQRMFKKRLERRTKMKKKTYLWWIIPGIIIYAVGTIVTLRTNQLPVAAENMNYLGIIIMLIGAIIVVILPSIISIHNKNKKPKE